MSDAKRLIKNTTIYAVGDIAPRLLSFITFPILTNYLTPAEYGITSYVTTLNTFLFVLCNLSLTTYYFVYYFRVGGEYEQKKLLGNLTILVIVNTTLISLLMFILGPLLYASWGGQVSFYPYIAIGVATNFFAILTIFPSALYRLQERPLPLVLLNIASGVITMTLIIVFVMKLGFKVKGVLYTQLIVSAIFGCVFLWITFKNAIWVIDKKQLKSALKFSLPLVPAALAYYLYSISDRILIDKYLTLTDLGLYSTAATIALLLNLLSNGAYKAFEPHFYKIFGKPGFNEDFLKVRNTLLLFVLLGALCLSLFSKEFFQVFSSAKYQTAHLFVPIIEIGAIAAAMNLMYGTVIIALDKTKINSAITIIGGLVSVLLNVILLRYIGILAAASVFSFSIILTLYARMKYTKLKIEHIRATSSVMISVLVMFLFSYFINIDNFSLSIFIKIIAISIMYFVLKKMLNVDVKNVYK